VLASPLRHEFGELTYTPRNLREYFEDRGIRRVVAFNSRNPMHRAHQELTLRASRTTGAHLLIHPVVGPTQPGDVDAYTRVRCYRQLLPSYQPGQATLALLPLAMRMAGPREALWHAIIRQNYGVTHMIVGRDHAGPGLDGSGRAFYRPYAAQELVARFADELAVSMVSFPQLGYVAETDSYEPVDDVPPGTAVITISGHRGASQTGAGRAAAYVVHAARASLRSSAAGSRPCRGGDSRSSSPGSRGPESRPLRGP